MMEEILKIYQGYLEQAEPHCMAWFAYGNIVNILQGSGNARFIKDSLHAAELNVETSELQAIYQAARYRVERILWPH